MLKINTFEFLNKIILLDKEMCYIDLAKAFDSIDNNIILRKTHYIWIRMDLCISIVRLPLKLLESIGKNKQYFW